MTFVTGCVAGNSDCTKTYAISTPKSGLGSACAAAAGATTSCNAGEGQCPSNTHCEGEWGVCNSACKKTFVVTRAQEGVGLNCDASDGDQMPCACGAASADADGGTAVGADGELVSNI